MSNRKDLANGVVQSVSGNTIVLKTGYGQTMPDVPFKLTCTPPGELSTMGNSEIVKVTGRLEDTLTIERAQNGTTQKDIGENWIVANAIYTSDKTTSDNVDFTTFPKIQYGGGNLSGNTTTRTFTPRSSGLLVVKSHSRRNQAGAADNVMDISISGATGAIAYAGIGYGTADAFASAQALATVTAGTPVTITMTATNPANSGYTFFVIPGTTELLL